MKINVTKSNLQKALAAVSKAVSLKPTIEILKNIALEASNGMLKVAATNLELSISTYIGADVIEKGATTVLAKTFIEFVSLLPDDNISIFIRNNELYVEAEKIKSKFATIPHDEFPELPHVDDSCSPLFKVEKNIFTEAVEKTSFACERGGMGQPIFEGVFFEQLPGRLNLVATDRFRLSKYSIPTPNDDPSTISIVVPYEGLESISRLCQESEDSEVEAYLITKNNQVFFKSGRIEVSSSLIDGDFPNYQAFMPQKTVCTYKVNVQKFIDAVKLSNVFAKTEDSLKVLIHKELGAGSWRLSSRVSEVGEYETELEVEVILEEEGFDINFSPKKIIDVLSRIRGEKVYVDVVVHPRTEHRMFIFREEENDNFLHLLTPLVGA